MRRVRPGRLPLVASTERVQSVLMNAIYREAKMDEGWLIYAVVYAL